MENSFFLLPPPSPPPFPFSLIHASIFFVHQLRFQRLSNALITRTEIVVTGGRSWGWGSWSTDGGDREIVSDGPPPVCTHTVIYINDSSRERLPRLESFVVFFSPRRTILVHANYTQFSLSMKTARLVRSRIYIYISRDSSRREFVFQTNIKSIYTCNKEI